MRLRSLLPALLLAAPCSIRAADLVVTHVGTPPAAQTAIDHAAGIWGGILESAVDIKVRVLWFPLGGATLGITFPNGRRDFAGAPLPQTWYASALANSIAGTELNPGESDMDIYLNSGTNWYLGTDGQPAAGQHDLVTVALHEMGHGLGFVGLSKKVAGQGSLGLLQMADFAPLTTSFPWPQLDTLPGVFDVYLSDQQDGPLVQMPNPGTQLGDAMTGDQLRFNGPLVMTANGGTGARMYAPSTFALGSSCVHFNESTFPPGDPDELMTPFSSAGDANHWPGPLCLALMQDIGWVLAPDVSVQERPEAGMALAWPNPAVDMLHVHLPGLVPGDPLRIVDGTGRTVGRAPYGDPLSVGELAPGVYTVNAEGEGAWLRFIRARP
ncbi:MAG: hypothetical protein JNJ64_06960 [Flavobacteriales bacterium]|nr:hypothetical protein [Flavobacteriales bacterium]